MFTIGLDLMATPPDEPSLRFDGVYLSRYTRNTRLPVHDASGRPLSHDCASFLRFFSDGGVYGAHVCGGTPEKVFAWLHWGSRNASKGAYKAEGPVIRFTLVTESSTMRTGASPNVYYYTTVQSDYEGTISAGKLNLKRLNKRTMNPKTPKQQVEKRSYDTYDFIEVR